jgi:hypothetical protein
MRPDGLVPALAIENRREAAQGDGSVHGWESRADVVSLLEGGP